MSFELLTTIALLCQVTGTAAGSGSTFRPTTYIEAKTAQVSCQQTLVTCVKSKAKTDANALAACIQAGGY